MNKSVFFHALFILLLVSSDAVVAQAPIQFESYFVEASQEDKFRNYLDTINKYNYIDNQIVNYCLEKCEVLFEKDLKITTNDKLKYILILINAGLDNRDPLRSFQLIRDYQHLLEGSDVAEEIKTQFSYLKAYTSFTLEDTKDAQIAFYSMNEKAKINKDTLSMIKALYSLGQIYFDDENYSAALEHFNKVKKLDEQANLDASNFCLIQLELCATYLEMKEYDKTLAMIEESLDYIDKNHIKEFKSDFLLLRGEIALDKKDFKTAQDALDETVAFMDATESYYKLQASKIFRAKLLAAQGLDIPALDIYETFVKNEEELSNKVKLEVYELIHKLCSKKGYDKKSYKYLTLAKELQAEMHRNQKKQETAYLKIKFDSAQKDKENELLAAKVLQKQSQNKLLYALIALSILGLLLLFGAYYQKQKFAQKLKIEVQNRTIELQKSNKELNKKNKELDEFNRILSHDLKEPLRSIVGFSSLLRKAVQQNEKAIEYSGLIEKSGKQLHQIIDDVSTYQDIENFAQDPSVYVNPQKIIQGITESLEIKYPLKSIEIHQSEFPLIFINEAILKLIFLHLIDNGVLYNQSATAKIQIRYFQRKENHVFEFQDNGIGIKPEYHQRIFEMFKRLHTRKEFKGSGLGLSMVRKMLEMIDGTISILNSNPTNGSTFEISFPIVQE